MRGFLWQDLRAEVLEEFALLCEPPVLTKVFVAALSRELRMRALCERAEIDRDLRMAPAALREFRHGLADRRSGRSPSSCTKRGCVRPPARDRKMCEHHLEIARRAVRRYEEKKMGREELPRERSGITQRFVMIARKFKSDGSPDEGTEEIKGYITANVYPDKRDDGTPCPLAGQLGEVFVKMGKPGSREALLDSWAIEFSKNLQRGESLEKLCKKHRRTQFEPSGGVVGVEGITKCTSPTDLVCSWLMRKYGGEYEEILRTTITVPVGS